MTKNISVAELLIATVMLLNTAWMLDPINMATDAGFVEQACIWLSLCTVLCLSLFVCSFWCTLLLFITASLASKCSLFPFSFVYHSAKSGHIWTVWRESLCFSFPLLYVSFFTSVICHHSSVSIILLHLILSQRGLRKSLTLCLTSKGCAREGQPNQDAVWASWAVHNRNAKECCAHWRAKETGKER